MSKLVITEKPSVAHTIAAVLGADARMDGYLEGGGYIVSWCVGHLAELANAEEYDPQFAKWRIEDLPILPDNWRYAVPHNKQKRFTVLRSLMDREDVTEIVNACDAGREGEPIFRNVYILAGCKKPIHNHIIWNSTTLDCERKFRDFRGSAKAVRRLSDTICVENGYSVIQKPKATGKTYYSLDCGDGIENAVLFPPQTPEEICERRTRIDLLYQAIASLPIKQAGRIYAHFILGLSQAEIARKEGISAVAVHYSIHIR